MAPTRVDVRFDVACSLYRQYQRIISRRGHSADRREVVEHALSLVLSDKRSAAHPGHLLRNVQRDAARSLRRRAASRPGHESLDVSEEEGVAGSSATPEEVLVAKERYSEVMVAASELGPDAIVAVNGLMSDEAIEETSARTGVAVRRLRYMRKLLREHVTERIALEDAA